VINKDIFMGFTTKALQIEGIDQALEGVL